MFEGLIRKAFYKFAHSLTPQQWRIKVPLLKGKEGEFEREVYLLLTNQSKAALAFFQQIPAEFHDGIFVSVHRSKKIKVIVMHESIRIL